MLSVILGEITRLFIYKVRPFGCKMRVLCQDKPVLIQVYILPVCFEADRLFDAVCGENDGIVPPAVVGWCSSGIDGDFHKNIQAVVCLYPYILEMVAFTPVHVDAETGLFTACQHDLADQQRLIVTVVDHELFGCGAYCGEYRIERKRVDREAQPMVGVTRIVFVQPVARQQLSTIKNNMSNGAANFFISLIINSPGKLLFTI